MLSNFRNGHHLFTRLVSLRALQAGAQLAQRLGDQGASSHYFEQGDALSASLSEFRANEQEGGYYRATTFSEGGYPARQRTGLDCATLLSIIHAGDFTGSSAFSPITPDILSTVREVVLSFQGLYRINDDSQWTDGWAIGRYAEDTYDGVATSLANPW